MSPRIKNKVKQDLNKELQKELLRLCKGKPKNEAQSKIICNYTNITPII